MNLNDIKKIYFIGIGGIGMSALARYFNGRGVEVHGYDKTKTTLTTTLESEGMTIHYEDNIAYIPNHVDLVVYTPAVPKSHGELTYFWKNGFPVKKRAEVLGIISRGMKAIGIGGTHGKTTTTTITTHVLRTAGIDCTAFLGGIAENFKSNYVEGKSEWVVIEADEFDRSFLHLNPMYSAIMSMDADHLDIYGEVATMHKGFGDFVSKTNKKGSVFVKYGLKGILKKNTSKKLTINTFGINRGIFCSKNVRVEDGWFTFDYISPLGNIENIKFSLPGRHNIENATVAIAIAQQLGADTDKIKEALQTFKGIKRRFEFLIRNENKVFIDDYAHHPSELMAAIGAAKELYPNKKLTIAFQPHLYTRTRDFVDGFAKALDMADKIYLLDIYPARELPIKGVTSRIIFDKMKNPNKELLLKSELINAINYDELEVFMSLGAGDIDTLLNEIKINIESKN